jgi:hypothetical protein
MEQPLGPLRATNFKEEELIWYVSELSYYHRGITTNIKQFKILYGYKFTDDNYVVISYKNNSLEVKTALEGTDLTQKVNSIEDITRLVNGEWNAWLNDLDHDDDDRFEYQQIFTDLSERNLFLKHSNTRDENEPGYFILPQNFAKNFIDIINRNIEKLRIERERNIFVGDDECNGEEDPISLVPIPPGRGMKLKNTDPHSQQCYDVHSLKQLKLPISPLTRNPIVPLDIQRINSKTGGSSNKHRKNVIKRKTRKQKAPK